MIYQAIALGTILTSFVANAHICMWAPVQRVGSKGAVNVDEPGESVCYLRTGPCGGVASGEPMTELVGGQDFSVLFQQNLNHFYVQNPGALVADFAETADPQESDFYQLASISDYNAMNEITQTNFTIPVIIPNIDCDHCVLRMRYVSNNPTEDHGSGTEFYQCADVSVTKSASVTKKITSTHDIQETGSNCCSASEFTMQGYETGSWRNPTQKSYYFDTANNMFRVDYYTGSGTTPKDGYYKMISNFTSGIEYYYNVNTDYCDLYGLNLWSNWCYGTVNSQSYAMSVTVGADLADVWKMDGNDVFTWSNIREGCIPVSMNRADTGETTIYYNYKAEAPALSDFDLPAACVEAASRITDVKTLPKSPRTHFH